MEKTIKRVIVAAVVFCLCIGVLPAAKAFAAAAAVKAVSIEQAGEGDFVYGISSAKVSFSVTKSCKKVTVYIQDNGEQTVFKRVFKKVKGNKTYTFNWDGKGSDGRSAASGSYSAVVTAGKSKLQSADSVYFYSASEFAQGNGSKKNPYQVADAEQLKAVAKHNGRHFIQTADIDCTGTTYLTLFSNEDPFSGSYDGQGHSIKNISISGNADNTGLFRVTNSSAVIRNVNLSDCVVSGNRWVGVLVGDNCGSINNCSITNCVVNGSQYTVGALAGENQGKIISCTTTGNTVSSTDDNVGSIAGRVSETGYISDCSATNNVVKGNYNTGGIAGKCLGSIIRCTARDVTVKGSWWNVGGIAGYNDGAITGCEVYDENGLIKGSDYCHGIMGGGGGASSNNTYYGELS